MKKIKFKKGDKVVIKDRAMNSKYEDSMLGSVGIVIEDSSVPYVKFSNGSVCCFSQRKLELFVEPNDSRESRVDTIIRIKYPRVSPSGQRYMSLERSEAIEVYEDLKKVLGL